MSMYSANDLRSTLNSNARGAAAPAATEFAAADYVKFYEMPPQETGKGHRTWYARGQNFIVAYTKGEPGAVLERKNQPDEYMAFSANEAAAVDIETDKGSGQDLNYILAIVPPGDSRITFKKAGGFVRLFTSQSADLAAKCANAASYANPHPNIPPLEPWPAPPGGFKLRVYSMDVPVVPGRFGRIWRSTSLMVNFPKPPVGPRATDRMSPHYHDDFEQCSLCLQGAFVHHLRWPWTTNLSAWREDDHEFCGAPSVAIIPPPAIHTSQSMDAGPNSLVDIFSPPRFDFSEKPGWVLNEDEYPMPPRK